MTLLTFSHHGSRLGGMPHTYCQSNSHTHGRELYSVSVYLAGRMRGSKENFTIAGRIKRSSSPYLARVNLRAQKRSPTVITARVEKTTASTIICSAEKAMLSYGMSTWISSGGTRSVNRRRGRRNSNSSCENAELKNWLIVVLLSVERRVAMLRGCYINSAC